MSLLYNSVRQWLKRPGPSFNVGTTDIALIGMPAWDVQMPFHALAVVASIAREAGASVRVYETNIDFYHQLNGDERLNWTEDMNHLWFSEKLPKQLWKKHRNWLTNYLDEVLLREPKMVGFSINMATRHFTIYAAKYIRSKRPDLPILFGGVDCFPGEKSKEFLQQSKDHYCNIIYQGEAEISFPKYVQQFLQTGAWKTDIPGFAFYDGDTLVDTGAVELPTLKEKMPTGAFDLLDLSRYTEFGSLPFYFTRGCPYKCQFCSETVNYRSFRCRKAEDAFQELQQLVKLMQAHGRTLTLRFSDSIFNANVKEFERFVDLILEHHVQVKMSAQGHIHPLLTTAYLEKMANAGFVSVFWGIESGSQRVVDLMKKAYKVHDARRILNDCSRLGIQCNIPILIGFPGELPEDIIDTVEFMYEYQDKPGMHFHLPVHIIVRRNTPLKAFPHKFGIENTQEYEWYTTDRTNTLPIRVARRFILRQVHSNRDLSMDTLVDTEEIATISFDEKNVALDMYRMLKRIYLRAGDLDSFYMALDGLAGPQGRGTPKTTDPEEQDIYQSCWTKLSKDTREGRQFVYRMIVYGLRGLKQKIVQRRKPDFPTDFAAAPVGEATA